MFISVPVEAEFYCRELDQKVQTKTAQHAGYFFCCLFQDLPYCFHPLCMSLNSKWLYSVITKINNSRQNHFLLTFSSLYPDFLFLNTVPFLMPNQLISLTWIVSGNFSLTNILSSADKWLLTNSFPFCSHIECLCLQIYLFIYLFVCFLRIPLGLFLFFFFFSPPPLSAPLPPLLFIYLFFFS